MTVMWCYAKKHWQRQRDHGDIAVLRRRLPSLVRMSLWILLSFHISIRMPLPFDAMKCHPAFVYAFDLFCERAEKGPNRREKECVCVAWRCVNFTNLIQLISISWHSGKHKSSDDINLKPNYKIQNTWHVERHTHTHAHNFRVCLAILLEHKVLICRVKW